jgi:hypothetical protein
MLCKICGFHGGDYVECLHHVMSVVSLKTDVSQERIASIIRVERICDLLQKPHGVTSQKTTFFIIKMEPTNTNQ